jgi:hypothetical protein
MKKMLDTNMYYTLEHQLLIYFGLNMLRFLLFSYPFVLKINNQLLDLYKSRESYKSNS